MLKCCWNPSELAVSKWWTDYNPYSSNKLVAKREQISKGIGETEHVFIAVREPIGFSSTANRFKYTIPLFCWWYTQFVQYTAVAKKYRRRATKCSCRRKRHRIEVKVIFAIKGFPSLASHALAALPPPSSLCFQLQSRGFQIVYSRAALILWIRSCN